MLGLVSWTMMLIILNGFHAKTLAKLGRASITNAEIGAPKKPTNSPITITAALDLIIEISISERVMLNIR